MVSNLCIGRVDRPLSALLIAHRRSYITLPTFVPFRSLQTFLFSCWSWKSLLFGYLRDVASGVLKLRPQTQPYDSPHTVGAGWGACWVNQQLKVTLPCSDDRVRSPVQTIASCTSREGRWAQPAGWIQRRSPVLPQQNDE